LYAPWQGNLLATVWVDGAIIFRDLVGKLDVGITSIG
jgi:hypothetical protein